VKSSEKWTKQHRSFTNLYLKAYSEAPYGFRYANATVLTAEEYVAPLVLRHASIAIADLLP
jgi:hypothetical protein